MRVFITLKKFVNNNHPAEIMDVFSKRKDAEIYCDKVRQYSMDDPDLFVMTIVERKICCSSQ